MPRQDATPQLLILVFLYMAATTITLAYLVAENSSYLLKTYNASVTSLLKH